MSQYPFDPETISRRRMLVRCGNGVGMLGLAALLGRDARAADLPLAARPPRVPGKAKHVIQLWMNGAPSQVDTFDPKPALAKYAGQRPASTANLKTENATG